MALLLLNTLDSASFNVVLKELLLESFHVAGETPTDVRMPMLSITIIGDGFPCSCVVIFFD